MEYTKGKWKVIEWNTGHGFNVFSENGFVATVSMDSGLSHTMRECKANARLIATAPKLYEILKNLSLGDIDSIYRKAIVDTLAEVEEK